MAQPSPEFVDAVSQAIYAAAQADEDAIRYMAHTIPVFAGVEATPEQGAAAGCAQCRYYGLWVDKWPGYKAAKHGIIFLFEGPLRSRGGNLVARSYETLIHEMNHALGRDHVLDEMAKRGAPPKASGRGCGACPGSR